MAHGKAIPLLLLCVICLFSNRLFANDCAVGIAAGGIVPRHENRIILSKEKLYVSKNEVRVEYDFLNNTDNDIETEVAFPVPNYEYSWSEYLYSDFNDFVVNSNGNTIQYLTQVKAYLNGNDITEILENKNVNICNFTQRKDAVNNSCIMSLSQVDLAYLGEIGALKLINGTYWPEWEVAITYHWLQIFPARSVTHVFHKYRPVIGFATISVKDIKNISDSGSPADHACLDDNFRKILKLKRKNLSGPQKMISSNGDDVFNVSWVKYILTTANLWSGPIRDFELIVEGTNNEMITFCWNGPIEKRGQNILCAKFKNFRPNKDIAIYFVDCRFDLSSPE